MTQRPTLPDIGGRPSSAMPSGSKATSPASNAIGCLTAVAACLATRAFLLPLGFGSDHDAWSVADTARTLAATGVYAPSRLPGHPVHELVATAVLPYGGALALSLVSLAASLVLLGITLRLGRQLGGDLPTWVLAGLCLHPLFWMCSADATDFMLATTIVYGALLASVEGRDARLCGALLGLACGTRFEMMALFPAIVAGTPHSRGRWTFNLLGTTAVVVSLLYFPVAVHYFQNGGNAAYIYVAGWEWRERAFRFAADIWAASGLLPLGAAVLLLSTNWRRTISLFVQRERLIAIAVLVAVAMLVVGLIHPSKPRYYLPVLPIALLTLSRIGGKHWMTLVVASAASYSVVYPDIVDSTGTSIRFGLRANNGLVVKDWIARWNTLQVATAVDAAHQPGDVVLLGYWLPVWRWSHPEARPIRRLTSGVEIRSSDNAAFELADESTYVHKLDCDALVQLQQHGTTLRYAEGIDRFIEETYGCRPPRADAIRVRAFGSEVSERFSLMCLLRCGSTADGSGPYGMCVQQCAGASEALLAPLVGHSLRRHTE